jgi:hypothetical protein
MKPLRLWLCTVFGLLLTGWASLAQAQSGPAFRGVPAPEFIFGEAITFRVLAESDQPIRRVTLYLQTADDPRTFVGTAQFRSDLRVTAVYQLEPGRRTIAAFTPVRYWWEIEDSSGASAQSPPAEFVYVDNRFTWETLATPDTRLAVHWYRGDRSVAQRALDAAQAGLSSARQLISTGDLARADIYLYASLADARPALESLNRLWADGYANAAANTILVTVDPEAETAPAEIARVIPHEVMHLIVHQAAGGASDRIPAWLNEGLAQMNEAAPNADGPALMQEADRQGRLLSLEQLCAPFPSDAGTAELAYAQSVSLTRYVRNQFGQRRLSELISAYAGGLGCQPAIEQALGQSAADFETGWRAQIRATPTLGLSGTALGWGLLAILTLLVGPTLGLLALRGRRAQPQQRLQ